PTYAFQRQHYWPSPVRERGDVVSAGMRPVAHGVLSAAIGTADGGRILTGRLPAANRAGWLGDHEVGGAVLLPAAMVMEWALRAADEVGCSTIEELVLQTPVVLDEDDARRVQVTIGAPGPDERRELAVYSQPEDDAIEGEDAWVCHATGTVSPREAAPTSLAGQWPPAGAEPLDVTGCYDRAAATGFRYGPAFRGLRAAWSDGRHLFAEVALPEAAGKPTGDFGIHPALLDAALHPLLLLGGDGDGQPRPDGAPATTASDGQVRLPFAWTGVSLHATGAATIRVRLAAENDADGTGERLRIAVADAVGTPVLDAASVVMRPVGGRQWDAGTDRGTRGLYVLDWLPPRDPGALGGEATPQDTGDWAMVGSEPPGLESLPGVHRWPDLDALGAAIDGGTPAPAVVLTAMPGLTDTAGDDGTAGADDGLTAVRRALDLAEDWLARPGLAGARLVVVTRGAALCPDGPDGRTGELLGEGVRADAAAARGALRALQAGHPGRFTLLDLDPRPGTEADAVTVLRQAADSGEPEMAVRAARVLAPRLVRAGARRQDEERGPGQDGTAAALDPDGTVLVTGGTGTLGGLVAEHLVRTGRARNLLLAGRRGGRTPGAERLVERLKDAGARVDVAAVDVTDAAAVERLVAGIDPAHPLTGVVHAMGTPREESGLAAGWARAAGAWQLHSATAGLPLGMFLVFSSAQAVLGGAGAPGEAAADAFCAALVAARRAAGLPGTSVSWGPWAAAGSPDGDRPSAGTDTDSATGTKAANGTGTDPGTDTGTNAATDPGTHTGTSAGIDTDTHTRTNTSTGTNTATDTGTHGAGAGVRVLGPGRLPALFEAVVGQRTGHLVAARLDGRVLSTRPADALPAVLRALVPVRAAARTAVAGAPSAGWTDQLTGLPAAEQRRTLLNLVRVQAAAVLGQSDPSRIEPERGFLEIGIDSLTAVELRNRLGSATGLRLPATVVFDHPSPDSLAGYLLAELAPSQTDALAPLLDDIDRLERGLLAVPQDGAARTALANRLRLLTARLDGVDGVDGPDVGGPADSAVVDRIQEASADEILQFIDENLGRNAAD
ncbi:KR domain-containing protein, partial [Streptomyces palmae]